MILHVLPLLAFTTFAGFAAGAYAVDAVCGNGREAKTPWLFPLVCVVLLDIGLCGTLAHLGQPLRFMNGMANPASGISQESYWAIALGIVIVVDLVISWRGGKTVRAAASWRERRLWLPRLSWRLPAWPLPDTHSSRWASARNGEARQGCFRPDFAR